MIQETHRTCGWVLLPVPGDAPDLLWPGIPHPGDQVWEAGSPAARLLPRGGGLQLLDSHAGGWHQPLSHHDILLQCGSFCHDLILDLDAWLTPGLWGPAHPLHPADHSSLQFCHSHHSRNGSKKSKMFLYKSPVISPWLFQYKPELCEKIRTKIGRPLWLTCVLVLVVGGVIMNLFFFFLVTWRHLLSGALLGLCGYTLGGGASLLARMNKPQVHFC